MAFVLLPIELGGLAPFRRYMRTRRSLIIMKIFPDQKSIGNGMAQAVSPQISGYGVTVAIGASLHVKSVESKAAASVWKRALPSDSFPQASSQ